jgi:hypothetical protein
MGLLEHEDLGRTPVLILANKQVSEWPRGQAEVG